MGGDRKAVRVRIAGQVQGVGFRVWTRIEAERLGLDGWVRNERDASVTALISGPAMAADAMLERFWEGPRGARVAGVTSEPADAGEIVTGFRIMD